MRGRNYCWVFLLLIFSGFTSASTITYYTHSTLGVTRFNSFYNACLKARYSDGVLPAGVVLTPTGSSTNQKTCSFYSPNTTPNNWTFGYSNMNTEVCRFGNTALQCNTSCAAPNTMVDGQCVMPSCPVGQKRNAGGQCEAVTCTQDSSGSPVVYSPKQDKCTKYWNLDSEEMCSHAGQTNTATSTPVEVVTADPDGLTQTTDKAMSCGINVTAKKCTTRVDGKHKCVVEGTYNGQFNPNGEDNLDNCPTQDCTTKPPETPKPEVPKPETSTDSKPCNYASVNGALECVSSSIENKEGTKNCGTFNGAWQCVKVPPTSNGISILTKVTTEATPDGGTKTTKTDTATQTKCSDIGKCTTSTTTNVNVTIKDGQGNTTSTTGTCKGDNCPDKNGNPDANGDGFGDCVGDDCGEDEETKVGAQDWYQEGEDTYASVLGDFADRVANIPVVAGVDNFLSVTPTGACPVWQVDAWVFHIRLDQFCQGEIPWDLIRAIVIGCFAFLAFRIAFL